MGVSWAGISWGGGGKGTFAANGVAHGLLLDPSLVEEVVKVTGRKMRGEVGGEEREKDGRRVRTELQVSDSVGRKVRLCQCVRDGCG